MKEIECLKIHRVTKTRLITKPSSIPCQQRKNWETFVAENAKCFPSEINMDYASFKKLLSWIHPALIRSIRKFQGGPILPENRLYAVLRWLAGQDYSDLMDVWGISSPMLDNILLSTIKAINKVPALAMKFPTTEQECLEAAKGFRSLSDFQLIPTCVCAIGSYNLEIDFDSAYDNGDPKVFFSQHFETYGMNIQGACDHQSRFLFLGIGGPGSRPDDEALVECPLGDMIENLPGKFCAIADCGYVPTEHVIPQFAGEASTKRKNELFNACAYLCTVKIREAFMLMERWELLLSPVCCDTTEIWRLVECIGRLHNFCIDECISKDLSPGIIGFTNYSRRQAQNRNDAAQSRFDECLSDKSLQVSRNRDEIVHYIDFVSVVPHEEPFLERTCYLT